MTQGEWLTTAEVAVRLAIAKRSVRRRAVREGWATGTRRSPAGREERTYLVPVGTIGSKEPAAKRSKLAALVLLGDGSGVVGAELHELGDLIKRLGDSHTPSLTFADLLDRARSSETNVIVLDRGDDSKPKRQAGG